MPFSPTFLRNTLTLTAAALLAACATTATRPGTAAPGSDDWQAARTALHDGDWGAAQVPLARLLQQDLSNGHLQFLHALTEEKLGNAGARARLELAAVGYENAARFAPGHYWALLHLGFLELQRGNHSLAQARFSEAAIDQPQRWEAFYGLGVASYYRRDLPLMRLAAQRSLTLAPEQPDVIRLGAFALAAEGEPAARDLVRRLAASPEDADARRHTERRVTEYLNAVMTSQDGSAFRSDGHQPPLLAHANADVGSAETDMRTPEQINPNQVVVEVTILLNSVLDQANRGVNLFDGLRVLYGYSNALTQTIGSFGRESTRTITSQISTSQLDYSLNLFNDSGQYYSVVARPSITAHLGRESQFFAGRTLNVEVSGINLGQLQPIDVGVQLNVLPEAISEQRVTFRLDAARSFLSQDQIGTFDKSLTSFRQSVSATADIEFGQTLVLSALSEQVSDKSFSKVPGVGDVPVANWFTRRSSDARRQESLLILVTPKLPLSFSTPERPEQRARAVEQLLSLWQQRIDPRTDVPAVIKRLQRSPWLRLPEPGDLRARLQKVDSLDREAIEESLFLARR